ncbi:MAG: flagellar hook protein FlgE [Alphaproteobacteria bacterium]|nr:flagellar hook protein FlgE [Alphaproteobacteria bacterium]MBU1516811.1 flagellar hook protein FlgE [Alphaproteobacteria bacterium]MBU2092505.1 flagellar hook protein FlgE [Alphaproteobacteria bacterium]MBU2152364.1 flagellar hook protein FlgE [Alphaproteobacteria bacterium]MBU2305575.1 flagellar hook protein FlgE [Alphaproteobacteria bacterium]
MDPISTARYGLMAASRSFETSAVNVATMGVEGAPDVDLAKETVNMIQAKTAFTANVSVIKFADQMWDSLLKLQGR